MPFNAHEVWFFLLNRFLEFIMLCNQLWVDFDSFNNASSQFSTILYFYTTLKDYWKASTTKSFMQMWIFFLPYHFNLADNQDIPLNLTHTPPSNYLPSFPLHLISSWIIKYLPSFRPVVHPHWAHDILIIC